MLGPTIRCMTAGAALILALSSTFSSTPAAASAAPQAGYTYTVTADDEVGTASFSLGPGVEADPQYPNLRIVDTASGAVISCGFYGWLGTITLGSDLPGADIAKLFGGFYDRCPQPGHGRFTLQNSGTWLVSFTGPTGPGGVTHGTIRDVRLSATSGAGDCSFAMTGQVRFKMRLNATQAQTFKVLAAGSTLTAGDVVGCAGRYADGDHLTIKTTFDVWAADFTGHLRVKSASVG